MDTKTSILAKLNMAESGDAVKLSVEEIAYLRNAIKLLTDFAKPRGMDRKSFPSWDRNGPPQNPR